MYSKNRSANPLITLTLGLVMALAIVGCSGEIERNPNPPLTEVHEFYEPENDTIEATIKVTRALHVMYPEMDTFNLSVNNGRLEAEFEIKGNLYEAYFSTKGKWLTTEVKIPPGNIPDNIYKGLQNTEFGDWQIGKIKFQQTPTDMLYTVNVGRRVIGAATWRLDFTTDGTLIGKEKNKRRAN
ncbi:MAG: PepSY-like domain-containing protein [Bacteroidota bacterium]